METIEYKGFTFYYKMYNWHCDRLKPWVFKKIETAYEFVDKYGNNFKK